MESVKISAIDDSQIKDFGEGNPIQVRVTAQVSNKQAYKKGNTLMVEFQNQSHTAKIVSDPLIISDNENAEVSLVIEKVPS